MKNVIFLLYIIIISSNLYSATKQPITVYGDCSSPDKEKWFKSKTYIDSNGDGKYDIVKTFWCNGKNSTAPYKPSFIINNIDDKIHILDSYDYDNINNLEMYSFFIKDSLTGPIIAFEFKEFSSDTLECISFVPMFYFDDGFDYRENDDYLKQQLYVIYKENQNMIIIQFFKGNNEQTINMNILDENNNSIRSFVLEKPANNEWNVRSIKLDFEIKSNYSVVLTDNKNTRYQAIIK